MKLFNEFLFKTRVKYKMRVNRLLSRLDADAAHVILSNKKCFQWISNIDYVYQVSLLVVEVGQFEELSQKLPHDL